MAERDRLDLEAQSLAAKVRPFGAKDPPDKRRRVATHRVTERGKVVLAEQDIACHLHGAEVEASPQVPRRSGIERVGPLRAQQVVAVNPRERGASGIEAFRCPCCFAHDDRRGEHLVDGPLKARQVGARVDVEGHHLAPSVHAGVGAAGACECDRVAQDPLEGRAEGAGYRIGAGLKCEPVVRRTEVGDEQPEAAPRLYCFQGCYERSRLRRARCGPLGRCRLALARA